VVLTTGDVFMSILIINPVKPIIVIDILYVPAVETAGYIFCFCVWYFNIALGFNHGKPIDVDQPSTM
jgi:hypothetical protein